MQHASMARASGLQDKVPDVALEQEVLPNALISSWYVPVCRQHMYVMPKAVSSIHQEEFLQGHLATELTSPLGS